MANAEDVAARFAGSWKLVSYERRTPTGEVSYPYGKDAVGWISYDGQGHMSAQIMKRDRDRFDADTPLGGTPNEKVKAFEEYIAYCGTYTVNAASGTVVHHVQASLYPNWVGKDQTRHFEFANGNLILTVKNGSGNGSGPAGSTSRLVWTRSQPAK